MELIVKDVRMSVVGSGMEDTVPWHCKHSEGSSQQLRLETRDRTSFIPSTRQDLSSFSPEERRGSLGRP